MIMTSGLNEKLDDLVSRVTPGKLRGWSPYMVDREGYKYRPIDPGRLFGIPVSAQTDAFAFRVYDSLTGGEPLSPEEGQVVQFRHYHLAMPFQGNYAISMKFLNILLHKS
mgnify:CR=1 FL=1